MAPMVTDAHRPEVASMAAPSRRSQGFDLCWCCVNASLAGLKYAAPQVVDGMTQLAWGPCGALLAVGSAGASISIYDTAGHRLAHVPSRSAVSALAWITERCQTAIWPSASVSGCLKDQRGKGYAKELMRRVSGQGRRRRATCGRLHRWQPVLLCSLWIPCRAASAPGQPDNCPSILCFWCAIKQIPATTRRLL